jgi:hypothetical protein
LPHVDPVNAPTLSPEHIKQIVYKAMPTQWQVQFVQTHHGVALVTLLELQTFMSNEKTFADGIQLTSGKTVVNCNHPASHCQERRPMAQVGRKMPRSFDRDNAQNQRNMQPCKTYGRRPNWVQDGIYSICRRHGGHLWSSCYDNPQGRNY